MTTTDLAAGQAVAPRTLPKAGAALDRWRVPLTIAVLAVLPFVLPSQALAVNVLVERPLDRWLRGLLDPARRLLPRLAGRSRRRARA